MMNGAGSTSSNGTSDSHTNWPAPGLPARLRHGRELRGLSPAELDGLSGNPKGACSRLEREKVVEISAQRFTRYARALGVAVQWLWSGEGPIDPLPPPHILVVMPDEMEMRRLGAKFARRDGVPERVIHRVVTNPAYNTRDMHRRPLHYWVGLFGMEAIEPANLARAVEAFRWDARLSSDDKAQAIEGARRRATERRLDMEKAPIGTWRDLLRVSHLDIVACQITRASVEDESRVPDLSSPPSRDACKKNEILGKSNLEVTFAASYPSWGGHTRECLVTLDAEGRHAEGHPGCFTVTNWPWSETAGADRIPTKNHYCSAETMVDFALLVLEKQVALQRTPEGGRLTLESDWIDGAIARLEALRAPK